MVPEKITVHVQHPTNPSDVLTAAVTPAATPKYMVDQMVQAAWLPAPEQVGQYKLRNAATGVQLLDHVTLAAAGVADGATLNVDHTTTGAFSIS